MGKTKIPPLYERLSRDDELQSESNSIVHQKAMLEDFAHRNNLPNPTHFTDDGISGTRFDRPGFTAIFLTSFAHILCHQIFFLLISFPLICMGILSFRRKYP